MGGKKHFFFSLTARNVGFFALFSGRPALAKTKDKQLVRKRSSSHHRSSSSFGMVSLGLGIQMGPVSLFIRLKGY